MQEGQRMERGDPMAWIRMSEEAGDPNRAPVSTSPGQSGQSGQSGSKRGLSRHRAILVVLLASLASAVAFIRLSPPIKFRGDEEPYARIAHEEYHDVSPAVRLAPGGLGFHYWPPLTFAVYSYFSTDELAQLFELILCEGLYSLDLDNQLARLFSACLQGVGGQLQVVAGRLEMSARALEVLLRSIHPLRHALQLAGGISDVQSEDGRAEHDEEAQNGQGKLAEAQKTAVNQDDAVSGLTQAVGNLIQ